MKNLHLYILSIILIAQWGVVSFIGGASKDGINNVFYYISFILFWLGLVVVIWTTARVIATK